MPETLYQAIGGADGCRKLAVAFYTRVGRDALLRPLFPGSTLKCAIEEFSAFLVQFLGGPAEEAQARWWLSLRESHARFRIGGEHRNAWLGLMVRALDDVGIAEPTRAALRGFFEESSSYVAGARIDASGMDEEVACRWQVQRTLDEAVAAIRTGDADLAIALAQKAPPNPGLLGLMIGSGEEKLLQYVRDAVIRDPSLVHIHARHGRTLLHESAASGAAAIVELLLDLGADANSRDGGGHTPLYSLGNECGISGCGNIVKMLVEGGARVGAADGVKHCTPLHMAARRGNTEIAEALLDCGAWMEARDSLGHTPLRRAVNCNKAGVAKLLLSRGADRHSRCGKGLTPLFAARGSAMKQLLMTEF
jgi:truncated hemoglobin YjbI